MTSVEKNRDGEEDTEKIIRNSLQNSRLGKIEGSGTFFRDIPEAILIWSWVAREKEKRQTSLGFWVFSLLVN